jgi:hypothetical protein
MGGTYHSSNIAAGRIKHPWCTKPIGWKELFSSPRLRLSFLLHLFRFTPVFRGGDSL